MRNEPKIWKDRGTNRRSGEIEERTSEERMSAARRRSEERMILMATRYERVLMATSERTSVDVVRKEAPVGCCFERVLRRGDLDR